ncbi:MAG: hypothetical protein U5K43_00920 [Halofilum sp. (in: g-proteobacteria)]|nr:hypothetical protein [Halofilum sp. (in: g-proteobacteria)]
MRRARRGRAGRVLAGAGLAAAVLLLGVSGPVGADPIRWKMPIAFSSKLPGLGSPSKYVEQQLKTASGGDVQVRVYEPDELVPPFEILNAVSDGKVSAGYTWIGYDQGKVPAVPLFAAVPFGLKPWAFTAWYYEGPGHEMLEEVYANQGYNVHARTLRHHRSGDGRLVQQADRQPRGLPGHEDPLRRPRRQGPRAPRRVGDHDAGRRAVPGAGEGHDRRHRVLAAGHRPDPRLRQGGEEQPLPGLAPAVHGAVHADQRRRVAGGLR